MKKIVLFALLMAACGPDAPLVDIYVDPPVEEVDAGVPFEIAGSLDPRDINDGGSLDTKGLNPGCFKGNGHKYGLWKHGKCE